LWYCYIYNPKCYVTHCFKTLKVSVTKLNDWIWGKNFHPKLPINMDRSRKPFQVLQDYYNSFSLPHIRTSKFQHWYISVWHFIPTKFWLWKEQRLQEEM
jgi:hypothetical protein